MQQPNSAPSAGGSVLLTVDGVELHKVELGRQELLREGQLVFRLQDSAGEGAPVVQAQVGDVTFLLCKDLPALQAARNVYSCGLPGERQTYFCLVLPEDAPGSVLDAVADVVQASSAFSTIETVEAAKEEVQHKLRQEEQQQQQQQSYPATGPITSSTTAAQPGVSAVPGASAGQPGHAMAPPQHHQQQVPARKPAVADRVAAGLIAGSAVVAATIASAAVSVSGAIRGYANKQTQAVQAGATPTKVSPHMKSGIKVAGFLASSAARVTGGAVSLVGKGADALAHRVARTLAGKPTSSPAPGTEGITPEQQSALKTVGAAALLSFVEVYDALEAAAIAVVDESGKGAEQYMGHRYGAEVAQATKDSVPVAKDMVKTGLNFSRLGPRAVVSRTAKRAAKMTLKHSFAGLHPDEQAAGQRVPAHLAPLRASTPAVGPGTGPTAAQLAAAPAGAKMAPA